MFDILIKNASIIDGSGKKAYTGDIGIIGDKISAMGDLKDKEAKEIVDATNLTVTPGFVDVHSHSDMTVQIDGRSVSQVRQGVTTYITGLCGFSLAPAHEGKPTFLPHIVAKWSDFDSYLKQIDTLSLGVNIGSYVGHGTLRMNVMQNPIGDPSEEEMQKMETILDESIKAGAFGISTGLEYNPGKASEMIELDRLCTVVKKHDALHTVHTRNRDAYYLSALAEVIDITKNTGVRMQLSHINPKYGRHDNTMDDLLSLIRRTREQGFEVTVDAMPSEWNHTNANALLPLWAQNISNDELLELLRSPEGRAKLKINPSPIWQLAHQDKWDRIYLFSSTNTQDYRGRAIADIAKEKNISGWDTFCWLIEQDTPNGSVTLTSNAFSLEDISMALKEPYTSIVSDVIGLATDGPLAGQLSSPNVYDWVPVFFQNYVFADKPIFTIEEAIMKLTSIPASQVQLAKRGLLKEGNYADIALIKMENLKSMASFKNPSVYSEGVEMVIVNGKISYKNGEDTINCNGRALRFKQD